MSLEVLNFENQIVRKIEAGVIDIRNIRRDLISQSVLWQQAKKKISNQSYKRNFRGQGLYQKNI